MTVNTTTDILQMLKEKKFYTKVNKSNILFYFFVNNNDLHQSKKGSDLKEG